MDRNEIISINILKNIIQAVPGSQSGDTVTIKITRLSDGYTWNFTNLAFESGSNSGNMTFVSDIHWKANFTPGKADTYIVYINDSTIDVDYSITYDVLTVPLTIPSGSWGADLTVGTNTFVTGAEAETYFATRWGAGDHWDALTDPKKEASIITAYYQLTDTGIYSFPSTVTDIIKRAQLEQSLFLVINGADILRRKGLQAQGVKVAGIVKETYAESGFSEIPMSPEVKNMLKPYLVAGGMAYAGDLTRDENKDVV